MQKAFYDVRDKFEPAPRDGFTGPVSSDVPVLSICGTNDSQTAWRWSEQAAATLADARVVILLDSGHGASLFSDCGRNISASFVPGPAAALDTDCVADLTPRRVMPDAPLH
jgi:pimeloyl-ACP methyl ester carboxylesterase